MRQQQLLKETDPRIWCYLEWGVLAIATLSVVLTNWAQPQSGASLLPLLSIIGMGLLGVRLPIARSNSVRWLYTGLEFLVIFLPELLGHPIVPLLVIVVVVRSCRLFQPVGRAVVSVMALLVFLRSPFFRSVSILSEAGSPVDVLMEPGCNPWLMRLISITLLAIVLMLVVLMFKLLQADQRHRQELAIAYEQLATAHKQLRQYALRIENQAALQERNRIAREIHDAVGHTLTAQSIQLTNALLFITTDPLKAESFVAEARKLAKQALSEVRQSVQLLRTNPIEGRSLTAAIAALAEDFQKTTAITPTWQVHLHQSHSPEVNLALYRVVQEALTNVIRHATATEVTIELWDTDATIHLCIADNGRGFNPAQTSSGFGLQGMRERIAALGGEFELVSQPQQGCSITATIPLIDAEGEQ